MTLEEMREIALEVGFTGDVHVDCPKCGHSSDELKGHKFDTCGLYLKGPSIANALIPYQTNNPVVFSTDVTYPLWKPVTQWDGKRPLSSAPSPYVKWSVIPTPMPCAVANILDDLKSKLPTRKATKPFIGYRAWYLSADGDGAALRSVMSDFKWLGPVSRADGKPSPWDPWKSYEGQSGEQVFGIYAYDKPQEAIGLTGEVYGRVSLSGTVVVHERGYRAEVATIQQIVLHPSMLYEYKEVCEEKGITIKESLAERYQCPVSYNVEDLDEHR